MICLYRSLRTLRASYGSLHQSLAQSLKIIDHHNIIKIDQSDVMSPEDFRHDPFKQENQYDLQVHFFV